MNNELFELCKEVYKRTGWDGDKQFAYDDTYGDKWLRYIAEFPHESREWRLVNMIPLYTSDYLLEKLRNYDFTIVNLNSKMLSLTSDSLDEPEAAILGVNFAVVLLKLVIALDDAGQLKEEE